MRPAFYLKSTSRKEIQTIYAKTYNTVLRNLLDIQQLAVAYHRLRNLQSILTSSELRDPKKEENQVETYLQEVGLEKCTQELKYTTKELVRFNKKCCNLI